MPCQILLRLVAFFSLSYCYLGYFTFCCVEMEVDKESVGGCGGLIRRKKGAVAMYINFSGIRMVFISCHLSGLIMMLKSTKFGS